MLLKAKLQDVKDSLLKELNDYKKGTSISGVQIATFGVEELIESGFVKRKVDLIIDYTELPSVYEYFNEECTKMTSYDIGLDISSKTVGELINQIILQSVKSKLNLELSNYLKEIKSNV